MVGVIASNSPAHWRGSEQSVWIEWSTTAGGSGVTRRFWCVETWSGRSGVNQFACAPSLTPEPRVVGLVDRAAGDLGGGLELLQCLRHSVAKLAGAVRRNVDDTRPHGDPAHFVGFAHARASLIQRFHLVAPHRRLAAALLGRERELASGIGDEDAPVARPANQPPRPASVV